MILTEPLERNSLKLMELFTINKVSLVSVLSCCNTRSITDDPYLTSHTRSIRDDRYWTFRKNSLQPIELSSINKVTLV